MFIMKQLFLVLTAVSGLMACILLIGVPQFAVDAPALVMETEIVDMRIAGIIWLAIMLCMLLLALRSE